MHTCPANAVDVDASFEFVNQIMGAEKGFFFFLDGSQANNGTNVPQSPHCNQHYNCATNYGQ